MVKLNDQNFGKKFKVRTWIEIDKKAILHNAEVFADLLGKGKRLMAVVKSNAYGHGLALVAEILDDKPNVWFGVDSIIEGIKLREEGIRSKILILGYTSADFFSEAYQRGISLTVSNFTSLQDLLKLKKIPSIHIKLDTGMHRQGFLQKDISSLISVLKNNKLFPEGIYTHYASAKDGFYPGYTSAQLASYKKTVSLFEKAGIKNFLKHTAASGASLFFPETHFDMARIGIALYGYYPSLEAEIQKSKEVVLKPALCWKAIVSEVKEVPAGSFVGYDLTERVYKKTKIAIVPVGYWHGYDRGLSGCGEVILKNSKAKILGRVSMDMIVVDVSKIKGVKAGDVAILLGGEKKSSCRVSADDFAQKIFTSCYEVLTRINPLIKRIEI